MRQDVIVAAIGIVVISAGGGCGDGGGGMMAVTAEQACAQAAKAYCAKFEMCFPALIKLGFGDAATCEARSKLTCAPMFNISGSKTTPAWLAGCAAALGPVSCEDLMLSKLPSACMPVAGTLPDGSACADGAQCQSTRCNKPNGKTCGACGVAPKSGESCAQLPCGQGLTCNKQQVCVAPGVKDAACDPDNAPCIPTLACYGAKCVAPLGVGATCDPQEKTTPKCDSSKTLYCHGGTKVCTAVVFAKAGEACGFVNMSLVLCSGAGECKIPQGTFTGVCLAPAADGGACDSMSGPKCMDPALCDGGVCKIPMASACQ